MIVLITFTSLLPLLPFFLPPVLCLYVELVPLGAPHVSEHVDTLTRMINDAEKKHRIKHPSGYLYLAILRTSDHSHTTSTPVGFVQYRETTRAEQLEGGREDELAAWVEVDAMVELPHNFYLVRDVNIDASCNAEDADWHRRLRDGTIGSQVGLELYSFLGGEAAKQREHWQQGEGKPPEIAATKLTAYPTGIVAVYSGHKGMLPLDPHLIQGLECAATRFHGLLPTYIDAENHHPGVMIVPFFDK